jgi:integrative and conjugative element protein (TIGR02256 family)
MSGLCEDARQVRRAWIPLTRILEMRREAQERFPKETGGILIGYTDGHDDGDLVIEHIIGPGPQAKHSELFFVPDHDFHEREVNRIYYESGRQSIYLGDWHSHPVGGPLLSKVDKATLSRIASHKAARIAAPVMALVVGPNWDLFLWRARRPSRGFWRSSLTVEQMQVLSLS